MTPDKFAPLFGLSAGLFLAFCALTIFCLLIWALVPFTLLALRKQSREQLEVLRRIEAHLGGHPPPAAAPAPSTPSLQHDPANVN